MIHRRSFGCRASRSSSRSGSPIDPRNFGIVTLARPEPPVPMWMPTGMSSSSARAKYLSSDVSLGDSPWYCTPISPMTRKPPLVNAVRSRSSDSYCPSTGELLNDVPMMTRLGAAAFHLRTDSSSPITTAVTLRRSQSASTAFMYASGVAAGCNGSTQFWFDHPLVDSVVFGSDARNCGGHGHIGVCPGPPPNVCTWMSITGGGLTDADCAAVVAAHTSSRPSKASDAVANRVPLRVQPTRSVGALDIADPLGCSRLLTGSRIPVALQLAGVGKESLPALPARPGPEPDHDQSTVGASRVLQRR